MQPPVTKHAPVVSERTVRIVATHYHRDVVFRAVLGNTIDVESPMAVKNRASEEFLPTTVVHDSLWNGVVTAPSKCLAILGKRMHLRTNKPHVYNVANPEYRSRLGDRPNCAIPGLPVFVGPNTDCRAVYSAHAYSPVAGPHPLIYLQSCDLLTGPNPDRQTGPRDTRVPGF